MNKINYEELYIDTLYHYLAEIYVISNNDIINKENKIKECIDKIKIRYKDNKNFDEINDLIKNIEEEKIDDFKDKFKPIIEP